MQTPANTADFLGWLNQYLETRDNAIPGIAADWYADRELYAEEMFFRSILGTARMGDITYTTVIHKKNPIHYINTYNKITEASITYPAMGISSIRYWLFKRMTNSGLDIGKSIPLEDWL